MDLTLLHPKIVHIPMALAVLMPFISGGLLLAWWRGVLPRAAWWGALALQGVLVASGALSMKTGEEDEEAVERVVPEAAIEAHEEAAETFEWAAAAVLAVMVGALVLRQEKRSQLVAAAATAATLVVLGLGVRVGGAGGDLVYKHDAPRAFANAGGGAGGATPAPGNAQDND